MSIRLQWASPLGGGMKHCGSEAESIIEAGRHQSLGFCGYYKRHPRACKYALQDGQNRLAPPRLTTQRGPNRLVLN